MIADKFIDYFCSVFLDDNTFIVILNLTHSEISSDEIAINRNEAINEVM